MTVSRRLVEIYAEGTAAPAEPASGASPPAASTASAPAGSWAATRC
ncbi:hypothetical protein ACFQZC_13645 [Streptacidiphilus monticola]